MAKVFADDDDQQVELPVAERRPDCERAAPMMRGEGPCPRDRVPRRRAGARRAGGRSGATPLTIGNGHKPGVAVDAAGGHYVVVRAGGRHHLAELCRLPRGAGACDVRRRSPARARR